MSEKGVHYDVLLITWNIPVCHLTLVEDEHCS